MKRIATDSAILSPPQYFDAVDVRHALRCALPHNHHVTTEAIILPQSIIGTSDANVAGQITHFGAFVELRRRSCRHRRGRWTVR